MLPAVGTVAPFESGETSASGRRIQDWLRPSAWPSRHPQAYYPIWRGWPEEWLISIGQAASLSP